MTDELERRETRNQKYFLTIRPVIHRNGGSASFATVGNFLAGDEAVFIDRLA